MSASDALHVCGSAHPGRPQRLSVRALRSVRGLRHDSSSAATRRQDPVKSREVRPCRPMNVHGQHMSHVRQGLCGQVQMYTQGGKPCAYTYCCMLHVAVQTHYT
jgi:hypothetical protein